MIAYADGTPVWTPRTTSDLLDRAARERPHADALICEGRRLAYGDYARAVNALAARLATEHPPGSRIAIALRNGMAICIAVFAAQRAGLLPTTLNPDYTARELRPMLEDAAPALVIAHPELSCRLSGLPFLPIEEDAGFVADLLAVQPGAAPLPAAAPDMDAVLQFTGGTTGRPKGVLLTHRAVATNVAQREARLPTRFGDERIVCAMPLFHSFAAAMGLNLAAYSAGALIILPRYRPDLLLDAIEAERVTRLPAGPTMFNSLLEFEGLRRERVASLRSCYSGSAALSITTLTRWETITGAPIHEGYGQSEAGPVLTYAGPDAPAPPGTVGTALAGTEMAIVDPVTAEPLPIGAQGEIVARGPQIMRGYLNNPDATAEALRDGWLHTGDIGMLDKTGVLTITDRKKDLAIVGGFNVYPREIDEVLMSHSNVIEAAALGVPDAHRGETIWAFVVGRSGLMVADVEAWCGEHLVRYKRPTTIRLVTELPRTPAGKIDKLALRRTALGELALVA